MFYNVDVTLGPKTGFAIVQISYQTVVNRQIFNISTSFQLRANFVLQKQILAQLTFCDVFCHSCEMSILLYGVKLSNQILPEEKRVNCDSSGT